MPVQNPPHRSNISLAEISIVVLAALLVSLAPSFQSLWIDEGTIGVLSDSPTFIALQQALSTMKGSETLMPLTTAYFWAWEKIVGNDEWSLRCGNLPWLWLGIGCMAAMGRRIGWPWLPLLFAIHPVVWFYADEMRPYAIQLGAASWMALGFVQVVQAEGKSRIGLWNLGLAAAITTLASFLGIFVVAASAIVLLIRAVVRHWKFTLGQYGILALMALTHLAIVLPMLSKLGAGSGGTKAWTVGVANIGFALYELLGFAGLGPGREVLRASAVGGGAAAAAHLLGGSLFRLIPLVGVYAALLYTVARLWPEPRAKTMLSFARVAASVPVVAFICLFVASRHSQFPFWGRHLSPTLPFMVLTLGSLAAAASRVWPAQKTALVFAPFFALLLVSSLELRFDIRHAKDDYRTAAARGRDAVAQGKEVCWIAAHAPATFYHLTLSDTWPPAPGTASLSIPAFVPQNQPDLMIVSKPDLYDVAKLRAAWLDLPGVQEKPLCPSFVIYEFPQGRGTKSP